VVCLGAAFRTRAFLTHYYDCRVGAFPVVRLAAIGLVAGVFSALFGVGGGIVIVPLLLLATSFRPHEATATSLGAIAITALSGVIAYALRHDIRYGYAVLLGLPAMAGALVGAALQQRLSARSLTLAFAMLLVALGIWLIAG
jgi:uncharacterized membrane protein YfcA